MRKYFLGAFGVWLLADLEGLVAGWFWGAWLLVVLRGLVVSGGLVVDYFLGSSGVWW